MTKSIDEMIEKYMEYREKSNEIEKKMNSYRNQIKSYLKSNKQTVYKSSVANVSLQTATKSTMTKSGTPVDVWNQYSKTTNYEILNVRPAKST